MVSMVKFLYLVSLVIWVGSMVFFSFVVAPNLFRVLPVTDAGKVVGEVLPRYYWVGLICGTLALLTLVVFSVVDGHWRLGRMGLLVLMILATLYAGFWVTPKARELREQIHTVVESPARVELQKQFQALHRQSVMLNVLVMGLGVGVLYLTAIHLRP